MVRSDPVSVELYLWTLISYLFTVEDALAHLPVQ